MCVRQLKHIYIYIYVCVCVCIYIYTKSGPPQCSRHGYGLADMHLIFSQLSLIFTFSDSLHVLKPLLMRGRVESGVLDEGDSAGVP